MIERTFELNNRSPRQINEWLQVARADGLEVQLVVYGLWYNGVTYHSFESPCALDSWGIKSETETLTNFQIPEGVFPPGQSWYAVDGRGGFRFEALGLDRDSEVTRVGPALGEEELRRTSHIILQEHSPLVKEGHARIHRCTCEVARDWRQVQRYRGEPTEILLF